MSTYQSTDRQLSTSDDDIEGLVKLPLYLCTTDHISGDFVGIHGTLIIKDGNSPVYFGYFFGVL